jgi:hypothetical protein
MMRSTEWVIGRLSTFQEGLCSLLLFTCTESATSQHKLRNNFRVPESYKKL